MSTMTTTETDSGRRARVAILHGVYEWWAPRNWESVPDHGAVRELSEPMSFAAAKNRCREFNRARREHATEWAILLITMGKRIRSRERNDDQLGNGAPIIADPKPVAQSGRAQVVVISGVYESFQPTSWRSVPSGGAICGVSELMPLCEARRRAKLFNTDERELHASEWAVVIVTDGRKRGLAIEIAEHGSESKPLEHMSADLTRKHYVDPSQEECDV